MTEFICPECYIDSRPQAFYVSRGETWWSVSADEASRYANLCPYRQVWPTGDVLGCPEMRIAIDRWLQPDRDGITRPIEFGAGEVSIVDVAAGGHVVEQRADCPVQIAPVIADSFRDPEVRAEFQRNPGSTEVTSFELRDADLVAARMILFKDGERITETRYIVDDRDYWLTPPMPRETHRPDTEKTVVIGINLAFRNYYHWLMQCLPAIECSVNAIGAANSILALPALDAWQEETLAMLGLADLPRLRIDFDCHYRFKTAHWCGYLNGVAERFLSPRCLAMLDRLASGVPPIPDAPERLYVARLDSKHRVIANEQAVRSLLEGLGFTTLVPGSWSFASQVGLFKSARIVVGGHGAGLTNLAFCSPGTTALELLQSSYAVPLMTRIAQVKGLNYHAECFDCEDRGDVQRHPWTVDLKQLETKLLSLF